MLGAVSEAAGLSRSWAATNLAVDVRVAAVRAEERRAADLGIRAVPTLVFGERSALSGAQPPEALAEAVRRALEKSWAPGSPARTVRACDVLEHPGHEMTTFT